MAIVVIRIPGRAESRTEGRSRLSTRPKPVTDRRRALARIRAKLERFHTPRFDLSMIVLATGFAGFFGSYVLLWSGMTSMAIRYPLAVVVAYLAFLGLLWCWLRWRRDETEDAFDVLDANTPSSSHGHHDSGWSASSDSCWQPGCIDGYAARRARIGSNPRCLARGNTSPDSP
jgi:hypothetical protein